MSRALYWRVVKSVKKTCLPSELKYIFKGRLGRVMENSPVPVLIKPADCDYLRGIRDAIEDDMVKFTINELLEAVEKHDQVEIWQPV